MGENTFTLFNPKNVVPKWEYRKLFSEKTIQTIEQDTFLEDALITSEPKFIELAKNGWEIFQVEQIGTINCYFLRRLKYVYE